jgi:hypothetical protein
LLVVLRATPPLFVVEKSSHIMAILYYNINNHLYQFLHLWTFKMPI